MKELNKDHLEILLSQVKDLQLQHPTATVYFDTEENRIIVEYPLPKSFFEVRNIIGIKNDL